MMILISYLCILSLSGAIAQQLEAPRVTVKQGKLKGKYFTTRNGRAVSGFLGIPFAKPPVGNLRFKSPQPPTSWTGVRDATTEGSPCVQNDLLDYKRRNVTFGSEDCLYLNVFTPKLSSTAKLPVMVYIHGGGFFTGSSTVQMYGPDFLLDKDVVLVVINYRLGPLGFLSTEDDELTGNYGLKDQTQALRWIAGNINVFGGNRDSVTIFGSSAGGGSVHLHMMSPLSKGLFHAAISESGTGLCQWATHPPGTHKKAAIRVAREFGCPTNNSKAMVSCLKNVPANDITSLTYKYLKFDMDPLIVFTAVIEKDKNGAFLTKDPWTVTTSVPWITGIMSEEGTMKVSSLLRGDDAAARVAKLNSEYKQLLPESILIEHTAKIPEEIAEVVKDFYFGNEDISLATVPQIINMYSDSWFSYCTAEAVRRHKGPVYYYYISYKGHYTIASYLGDNIENLGTCHGNELIYLFPMNLLFPNRSDTIEDVEFSKNLVELWTNFALYRNPTPKQDSFTKWEPVTTTEAEYLHMKNNGFVMENNLWKERIDFWKNLNFREKPEPSP